MSEEMLQKIFRQVVCELWADKSRELFKATHNMMVERGVFNERPEKVYRSKI